LVVPDITAVQGRETAAAVTVRDPLAVKVELGGSNLKAEAGLAKPRDMRPRLAIAVTVLIMGNPYLRAREMRPWIVPGLSLLKNKIAATTNV
jgi:hypothetical protein